MAEIVIECSPGYICFAALIPLPFGLKVALLVPPPIAVAEQSVLGRWLADETAAIRSAWRNAQVCEIVDEPECVC